MTVSTTFDAGADDEPSGPVIRTFAGAGVAGCKGDNKMALEAELHGPYGIVVDGTGTLYFCDRENNRVRKVTTDGRIRTVAGTGAAGFSGDDGSALSAQLNHPRGVAADSAGNLYIADSDNHRVRKVTPDGKISTFAGTDTAGSDGDGGPAAEAQLNLPIGVAVDSAGDLYIADNMNHRVRKVTMADGKINAFAGDGTPGNKGDDGSAVAAQLKQPVGVAVDGRGEVYITDFGNHRVRKVTIEGKIRAVAGTGTAGFGGDGGPATSAQLHYPVGVVVDSIGDLYIADRDNHRVRKVAHDGKISTVAGTDTAGFDGDGGPAAEAELNHPYGLAVDCVDALYITDFDNHRVRKVAAPWMAGLPASGTVVSWANVRSRLRMGVQRESTKDGAEIQQTLAVARDCQRWRLVVVGQDDGEAVYRVENVRSGKVLEVVGGQEWAGAVLAQRAYEGDDAHHQQWRLIPVGSVNGSPRVYEIANHRSGLLLQADTNARAAIRQDGADGDHRGRQWQLLPV
ncbi:hypothetical protein GCM10018980_76300 [Streptomyces capoamus]|uniref:Ricin B lectin domain-containing protein n=1 Tax=Streptomyces capoamus TaxID=68183 RepID=A0A919F413_9ACTN|nr:RICIN domain-containing protein [Streptomyces capoamus]GHG77771.1 hypothetical protein GCM10018980_76300 [Streptomyces capoamus]